MMKQNVPSSTRWLPSLIVAITLVAILLGGLVLHYVETTMVAAAGESLSLAAVNIADKLDMQMAERYGDIQLLSQSLEFQGHDYAAMERRLHALMAVYPVYRWAGVTDVHGRVLVATDRTSKGRDLSWEPGFQTVKAGQGAVIQDATPDDEGVLTVTFVSPLHDARGAFLGAVISQVGLPVLEDVFARVVNALQAQWGSGARIEYLFLDHDGNVFVDSFLREEGLFNLKQQGVASARLLDTAPTGFVEEQHSRRKVDVVTGYAQTKGTAELKGLQWGVLVRVDRIDILIPIRTVMWKVWAAGVGMLLPLFGVLLWSITRLTQSWRTANEERNRAQAAERKFHTLLEMAPDAIVMTDTEGTIVLTNRQVDLVFGYPPGQLIGQPIEMLVPESARDIHRTHRARYHESPQARPMGTNLSLTGRRRDGTVFPILTSLSYVETAEGSFAMAAVRDITERKLMEGHTLKMQRLASLGQLLGGIAHEIRNPVFILTGWLQLMREKLASREYDQLSGDLQKTEGAAQRITAVAQRFLALAKPHQASIGPCLVPEVLQEICGFLANECMRQHVRVDTSWSPTLPPVRTDRHQLGEAVMNLMLNAIQAMAAAHGGGTLTVKCAAVSPQSSAQEQGGPWIEVRIQDDGPGIAPEHRAKLFEPFFSTKPSEEGTGLGLWMVRTFVMTHQGTMDYETEVGRGTTFIVRLPVLSQAQPGADNSPVG